MKRNRNERRLTKLILCALLTGLVMTPATAGATAPNIGRRGDGNCKYEWWGKSGTDLNPNGNYAYYVQEEDYNHQNPEHDPNNPKIREVCGWHEPDTGDADSNKAVIGGRVVLSNVYGGYSTNGAANKNVLIVNSGTISGNAVGGYANESADALENTVYIYGGNFTSEGGKKSVSGGQGKTANKNVVFIYGGTFFHSEITGGTIMVESDGTATNNTVVLAGNFSGTPGIYGGAVGSSTYINFNIVTGNTLEVWINRQTVNHINNFQNYYFILPAGIKNGDTVLNVTGSAKTEFPDNATIGVAMAPGAKLHKGDKVTLIKNANEFTGEYQQVSLDGVELTGTGGVSRKYEFALSNTDTTIDATVTEADVNEQAKSLVETRAATTTFVNAGSDMLASQGFQQAANAVAIETAEQAKNGAEGGQTTSAFTPFAAFGGSSMRAESGSYVDTRGFGLNIGFARELPNSKGKLLFAPIIEYGGGSYDSHLDDGTRGDGSSRYWGVGVIARQVNHDGLYYEGSLRGGRVTSDYKGGLDGVGRVDYDSASNYVAAHLGVGKVFKLGKGNTLDGYFKYFFSHQTGDTTTVHAGAYDDIGDFAAVNSHRIRLGAKLTHKINEKNKIYGGLAYQYEFNGDARATFDGESVPSPSLKGSSGMLELGWQVKPGEGPLTLDLGVTGWAGKQRGASVQLGATWNF